MPTLFKKVYKKFLLFILCIYFVYFFLYFILTEHNQQPPSQSAKLNNLKETEKPNARLPGREFYQILSYKKLVSVYVYSAFVDMRQGNMGYRKIRMMTLLSKKISLTCSFVDYLTENDYFVEEYRNVSTSQVEFYEISENHGMRYKVYILSCSIPDHIDPYRLQRIHLIADDFEETQIVPISDIIPEKTPSVMWYNFTLCTPVVHGNSSNWARYLIEFLEISLTLGAQHIYIYYYGPDMKNDTLKVLDYYANLGVVTSIRVELYMHPKLIWNYGQLLVVQDCLYRNMNLAKFTLFADLDEHFVPYAAPDWSRLSEYIFKNPNEAAYSVGSYSFIVIRPSNNKSSSDLVAPNNVECTEKLDHLTGKSVVRPRIIFEMGVHHVSRVTGDHFVVVQMNPGLGAIHHFRPPDWRTPFKTMVNKRLPELLPDIRVNYNKIISMLNV